MGLCSISGGIESTNNLLLTLVIVLAFSRHLLKRSLQPVMGPVPRYPLYPTLKVPIFHQITAKFTGIRSDRIRLCRTWEWYPNISKGLGIVFGT